MNISQFLNTINSAITTKFKIAQNSGLEITQLRKIENEMSVILPNDLVEFYTISNGVKGNDYIFNIIPFENIEKETDELGSYLIFSEYMIYSETCGLEIDPIDNNKYRFFNTSSYPLNNGIINRNYVADSIIDFIKLYCQNGTLGIWREDNKNYGGENSDDKVTCENDKTRSLQFKALENKKPWWKFW